MFLGLIILRLKNVYTINLKFGYWNVWNLNDNQHSNRPERGTAIIAHELSKQNIDISVPSETRLVDKRKNAEH